MTPTRSSSSTSFGKFKRARNYIARQFADCRSCTTHTDEHITPRNGNSSNGSSNGVRRTSKEVRLQLDQLDFNERLIAIESNGSGSDTKALPRKVPKLGKIVEDENEDGEELDPWQEGKLNFTWMLTLQIPKSVTPEQQSAFERLLKARKQSSAEAVQQAFSFVEPESVKEVMKSELAYGVANYESPNDQCMNPSPSWAESKDSSQMDITSSQRANSRMLHCARTSMVKCGTGEFYNSEGYNLYSSEGSNADDVWKEPPDSFSRALQCSMELVIAYFSNLDVSSQDALSPTVASHSRSFYSSPPRNRDAGQVLLGDSRYVKTCAFKAQAKDMLYVCVRLDKEVAEYFADLAEYPVQLSREGVANLGMKVSDTSTSPAYCKYDICEVETEKGGKVKFRDLCRQHPDPFDSEPSILRPIDRIRLLHDKITDSLELNTLQRLGLIRDSLPLHHHEQLGILRSEWGNFGLLFSIHQPLDKVRDYFGEEVAFYFVFLNHLIIATLYLCVPALFASLWSYFGGTVEHAFQSSVVMFIIVQLWYFCFQKSWQREQARRANQWGLDQHQTSTVKQLNNYRFHGHLVEDPENELRKIVGVRKEFELLGHVASLLFTFLFVALIILLNVCEFYGFTKLSQRHTSEDFQYYISVAIGMVSGVQIKVVDNIWDGLGALVTDLECHRLDKDFNRSKSLKASVVRFINTVSPMLFFAFARPLVNPGACSAGSSSHNCTSYLSSKLTSIFVTRFFFLSTLNDVVKPYLGMLCKKRGSSSRPGKDESFTELQAMKDVYGTFELTSDFLDVLLPLSFIIFFGTVDPSSVFLLLLVLLIQVRQDAWKLLHLFRRPFPNLVTSIGGFNVMLGAFGPCMIFTNLALMFIYYDLGNVVEKLGLTSGSQRTEWVGKFAVFCLGALLLILLWRFIDFVIPDTSEHVQLEKRRQNLQRHHLFYSGGQQVSLHKIAMAGSNTRVDFGHIHTLQSDGFEKGMAISNLLQTATGKTEEKSWENHTHGRQRQVSWGLDGP